MKKIIDQVAKIVAKNNLNYDQTKYLFKEVRKKLELSAPEPKNKGTVKRMSAKELEKFINQAFEKSALVGLMIFTLAETACRNTELRNLEANDIYFGAEPKLIIKKGKGSKRREIPISTALANMLQLHLDKRKSGPIFRSQRNTKFSARRIQQIVKEIFLETGITLKVTPHTFRHTRATLLAEKGMSKDLLKVYLGHSKLETTEIYTDTAALPLNQKFREIEANS